jgi:hypothetical protein
VYKEIYGSKEWTDFHEENKKYKSRMAKKLKTSEEEMLPWIGLFDVLNCVVSHNKTMPPGFTKKVFDKVHAIFIQEMHFYLKNEIFLKYGIGIVVYLIKRNIFKKNVRKIM